MMGHYILDGHTPIPCDLMTWAANVERGKSHVGDDTLPNGVRVSTVFLGLDHSFTDSGPPILFETMIFGGEHDQYQERYATWDEAEKGHAVALAKATT